MLDNIFGTELPVAIKFAIAFVAVVLFLVGLRVASRFLSKPRADEYLQRPSPVQIAHMTEHVSFTFGGGFAVAMLILFNIALTITYLTVTNVLQQNVALLSWVGWNILWGIGAIIGRRREYIIYRDVVPAERQEPRL